MKYTVIIGGNPYTVVADHMHTEDGTVTFFDEEAETRLDWVAEFKQSSIDGIVAEDNNVS